MSKGNYGFPKPLPANKPHGTPKPARVVKVAPCSARYRCVCERVYDDWYEFEGCRHE